VSIGNNWGYGSANPVVDGCVVVSLSRMNRIELDEELGLATLEPGVTQGQLAARLATAGRKFLVPTTGAGPSGSILGNALERGYGITPLADHFGALTSLKAVLPDGETYASPLGELGAPGAGKAFKWGLGPYLDGLFSQGAFGIVTEATFALARRPERVAAFLFGVDREDRLSELVEAVREIVAALPGAVGGVNLMNARRVLAMVAPFPSAEVGPDGLIPEPLLRELCRRHQVMPWTGFGTLYGTDRVVRAARREIRSRLRRHASRLIFVTPGRVDRLRRIVRWIPSLDRRLGGMLGTLRSSLELVAGIPNETALPLAYWKRSGGRDRDRELNPARDGCGLIWYAPLVEMKGARVRQYVDLVTRLLPRHGVEPLITLTSLSERCFSSTVPILFDADSGPATASAQRCYAALLDAGRGEGFLPYRVGVQTMEWLMRQGGDHWTLVAKLKAAVDPLGIVSPGRYSPPPGDAAR
jgi:FAD/FMN-containing dehydrogenase